MALRLTRRDFFSSANDMLVLPRSALSGVGWHAAGTVIAGRAVALGIDGDILGGIPQSVNAASRGQCSIRQAWPWSEVGVYHLTVATRRRTSNVVA
jgi:hypothetical protein